MLPKLALIADRFTHSSIADKTIRAVEAGAPWVHLRDHEASEDAFYNAAANLIQSLRGVSKEVLLTINGRPAVAERLGTHYHAGRGNPPIGNAGLIGYSVHNVEEGLQAQQQSADYLFYSPIFATTSKPGAPGVGLEKLEALCHAVAPVSVFALGGITPDRCASCLQAGAKGVAVLSGILAADSVEDAVDRYLNALGCESKSLPERLSK